MLNNVAWTSSRAWTRSRRPSLPSRLETWLFTVASATTSAAAISALDRPRGEQPEHLELALGELGELVAVALDGAGSRRATWSSSRRVTAGESTASPAATAGRRRRARRRGASLSRKPLAPARSASTMYSSRPNVVRTSTRVARQPARRLDAVHARHADVHQHDVGRVRSAARDRLLAVAGLGDDLDARRSPRARPEAGAHRAAGRRR